ncbi:MAG: hypothetical protein AB1861_08335 [Cyanobacteriota bacterium]
MTINISARNYSVFIAGLDCTTALKSADGGFAHYDQTGLSLISATFVLGKAFEFSENLDDRINSRWARGNLIIVSVANSLGVLMRAPVLGQLYILESRYDENSRELTIEAGCILSLLNFRSPSGEGICFSLGNTTSLTSIASKLLQKAGVPGFAGAIAGAGLSVPLSKLSNESYIQLFGKICWANGQIAYQDNYGQIRVKPVSRLPPTLISGSVYSNAVKYERLSGAEAPCEKIVVTGTLLKAEKPKDAVKVITEEYGPVSLIDPSSTQTSLILVERTIYTEKLNPPARTITKETEKSQARALLNPERYAKDSSMMFAEIKLEKHFYEAVPNGGAGTVKCTDPDEGRLIKSIIETRQCAEICLREWLANQPEEIAVSDRDRLILASRIVITYEYPSPVPNLEDVLPGSITALNNARRAMVVTTETSECQGTILPGDFSMEDSYGGNTISAPIPSDAKFLTKSEIKTETWTEFRPGDWEKKTRTYQVLAKAYPEVAERLEENLVEQSEGNEVLVLNAKLSMVPLSTEIERSNSGQAQPPAPERFPPEFIIVEKPVRVEVKLPPAFGSQFRPREREFTVDGGLLTSRQQAEALGRIEGHILWGRYKGQSIVQELADPIFGFSPLAGAQWTDAAGYTHLFMMDGFSVALAQKRFVCQYDGIWCGLVATGVVPPVPIVIAPPPPVTTTIATPVGTITTTVTITATPASPGVPASTTATTVTVETSNETAETTTNTTTEELWTNPEESDAEIVVALPYQETTQIELSSRSSFSLRTYDYDATGTGANFAVSAISSFSLTTSSSGSTWTQMDAANWREITRENWKEMVQ